jgi:hypothetical protein
MSLLDRLTGGDSVSGSIGDSEQVAADFFTESAFLTTKAQRLQVTKEKFLVSSELGGFVLKFSDTLSSK